MRIFALRLLLSSSIALCLSACTSLALTYLNNGLPGDETQLTRDLAYGDQPWQKLDLYVPANATRPTPLIVFFYGGGWSMGQKEDYRFLAASLNEAGYAVAIPDYVKYPQAKFPAFMWDAAAALQWLRSHGERFGVVGQKPHLIGHSAGAHMAALLVSDPRFLPQEIRREIRSVAAVAGPYNFTPTSTKYIDLFNGPSEFPKMKVPNFISGDEPPMLLLSGRYDGVVSIKNSEELATAIRAKGGQVETRYYEALNHYDIIAVFSPRWRKNEPVAEDILAFMRKYS